MNIEFFPFNQEIEKFSLGTVSFNFLDKRNLFDSTENTDYDEELICKLTEENSIKLAEEIKKINFEEPREVRQDIKEKILKFSEFCLISKGFNSYIR